MLGKSIRRYEIPSKTEAKSKDGLNLSYNLQLISQVEQQLGGKKLAKSKCAWIFKISADWKLTAC